MIQIFCALFFIFSQGVAWSEVLQKEISDSKAAPHQGYVENAGPFQIELLFAPDESLKVYLLDSDLKNATVQNSEIDIFIKSGNVESEMSCQPVESSYFMCKQNGKKFKKGELSIAAKRNGVPAGEVKVKLPFPKNIDATVPALKKSKK